MQFKNNLEERCYHLGLGIIRLVDKFPNKRSSWIIGDQVMRSATSIGANVIEARASSSRLEFKKFHEIALKSAHETVYWLSLAVDAKIIDESITLPFINETSQIASMLGAGVIKLKAKKQF